MATIKESDIRPPALFQRYLELVDVEGQALAARADAFVTIGCPGCGAGSGKPDISKSGFQYCICPDCESLFVSPRPTRAEITAYYQTAPSVKFWSTHFFRETREARRERMFRPRAELVGALADRLGLSRATLVDIGSGYGIFLEEVRKLGAFARVVGVEPEPDMAALSQSNGFEIVRKPIEAMGERELQADVATAFEVLEHVFDPLDFLRGARRVLRPGGVLMLTTQTVDGFDIQVLWERSKSLAPPQHINLLSRAGMRALAERAGLRLEELSTPGVLDVDIVRNAAAEADAPTLPRFVRTLLGQPEATRAAFQTFLREHGLSSHMRALLRRPEDDS